MKNLIDVRALGWLLLSGVVSAQVAPELAVGGGLQRPCVPLHEEPGDPGRAWAAGARYKVAFDAAVEFVPYLGSTYPETVALKWRTARVLVGDDLASADRPRLEIVGDYRAGCDWTVANGQIRVEERYEVRREGVEQTFVVGRRPQRPGPIVVTGEVRGALTATARRPEHAPLSFCDSAGDEVVRYGAATVIDARGRVWPVGTGFEQGMLSIVVPADVVRAAAYPLLIDPLLSARSPLSGTAGKVIQQVTLGEGFGGKYLVGYCDAASAGDRDVTVFPVADDFSSVASPIFADLSTTRRTSELSMTTAGANYIIAMQYQVPGLSDAVVYHTHGFLDPTLGTFTRSTGSIFFSQRRPRTGSTLLGDALLTCEEDRNGTTTIVIVRLSGVDGAIVQRQMLATSPGISSRRPFLSPRSRTGLGSPLAWQEYDAARGNWDVIVALVSPTGSLGAERFVVPVEAAGSSHELGPVVAGEGDLTLVGFSQLSASLDPGMTTTRVGETLQTAALRWSSSSSPPTVVSSGIVEASNFRELLFTDLVQDGSSSLFSGCFRRGSSAVVARLGFMGNITEQVVPQHSGSGDALVAAVQDSDNDRFAVIYAFGDPSQPIFGTELEPATALPVAIGAGCGPRLQGLDRPLVGRDNVRLELDHAPPGAIVGVNASLLPAMVPLAPFGMPGCVLRYDPAATILTLVGVADQGGSFTTAFALPDRPYFSTSLYAQGFALAASSNPAGITASNGLELAVR